MQEVKATDTPDKLFNKNFILLWQGQFFSKIGNQVYFIAIIVWLKQTFESTSLNGLFSLITGTTAVLLTSFGGVIADRFSRKKIIVYSDFLSGLAVLSVAYIMLYQPAGSLFVLIWLFAVSVILSSMASFFGPAIGASIPDMVPKQRIAGANSMGQFSDQISVFIGQGFGVTLYQIFGAPLIALINGISFLFSAFSESFIVIPQKVPEKITTFRIQIKQFKKDLVEGFSYVARNPGLSRLLWTSVFINFFTAPIIINLIFFVEDYLKVSTVWFSIILVASGIGALIGYISAGLIQINNKTKSKIIILFIILEAFGYGALGFVNSAYQATFLAFLGGIFTGFVMVNLVTILQMTTPSEIRGRVLAVLSTISASIMPLGSALGGIAADLLDRNFTLLFAICGFFIALFAISVTLNSDFRKFIALEKVQPVKDISGFNYKIKVLNENELLIKDNKSEQNKE